MPESDAGVPLRESGPEHIWLQCGEDRDESTTTWCVDRINDSDVEYVKASALAAAEAARDGARPTDAERNAMAYAAGALFMLGDRDPEAKAHSESIKAYLVRALSPRPAGQQEGTG